MPLDIERFETAEAVDAPTTGERIMGFLAANDTQAYTRREIADAIDADPETVGTNLTRLKRRGLVRHREPYWALTGDLAHARDVLSDRYGERAMQAILGEADTENHRRSPERTGRPTHRTVAEDYFDRVRERLGEAVEALHLFGSVAREAETPDSDVDVLAVVADEADFTAVDDVLLELAYEVQLDHEVRVEVHAIRSGEFASRRDRGDPFVTGVLAEAGVGE